MHYVLSLNLAFFFTVVVVVNAARIIARRLHVCTATAAWSLLMNFFAELTKRHLNTASPVWGCT